MFPRISNKTDRSGHCLAFPDVCKIPAPPAPFVPTPYPAEHGKMLDKARKTVIKATKDVENKAKGSRSSGDEAGTQKALVSMKNMDKLIQKHLGELKKAPRLDYDKAKRIQAKFEKDVERQVKELEKSTRNDREMQKVVKDLKQTVGKAARAN